MASKTPPPPSATISTTTTTTTTTTNNPSSPTTTTAAATPQQFSINFGTPEAVTQVHTLTDLNTITRLLHECIAYQRSLDLSLESLLSQRSSLDTHLSSLLNSSKILSIVKSDADHILSSVNSTSLLADTVSAKVRELDLAQSRVSSTLLRLDAISLKSSCIDSVKSSLQCDDFESAAEHVKKFLEIDDQFRDSSGSSLSQREELLGYKKQLEGVVKKKLLAAVDQRDHPLIVRFIKLYPLLGIEEEGLQVYVNYLRKVISMRSRMDFEQLVELMENRVSNSGSGSSQVDFVACLTNLFSDIVLAVEENDEVLRSLCGEDGIFYAICELQEECDSRGSLILKKYMDYRKLMKLTEEIISYSKNLLSVGSLEGPDPREVELYLEEILSLTRLGEDYTAYMLSKIKGLSSTGPEVVPQATKLFRNGNFNRGLHEVTEFYVVLEEFFMEENVKKAIKIDEHVSDSLTTSMVDDVFYVLQSCCRRAISTSKSKSVAAVLTGAANLLKNEYLEALKQKMREPNLGAKLFLGGVGVQKTGIEIATALNNVDVSSEYILKLRHEIEEQCAEVKLICLISSLPNDDIPVLFVIFITCIYLKSDLMHASNIHPFGQCLGGLNVEKNSISSDSTILLVCCLTD